MDDERTAAEARDAWSDVLQAAELADRLAGDATDTLHAAPLSADEAHDLAGLVRDAEEAAARALVRAQTAAQRLEATTDA